MIDLFGDKIKTEENTEIKKESKYKLFDYLNDINHQKKNLFRNSDNAKKHFNKYIVLNGLSFNIDTIMYANEVNQLDMPDEMAYDFLVGSIKSKKRYSKWIKSEKDDDLAVISEYFNYSYNKAREALRLISKEQLTIIKNKLDKGGMK